MRNDPVIIIGAPRSGTNMLRDVLTCITGVGTWPCDEINYIWRHGNAEYPSDELPLQLATPPVRRYIRRQFEWVAHRYRAEVVVEKTCANSLRVPFVNRILPEARYIFIRRNGLDAIGSALKCWSAPLNISYVARKARFVPITDLPYYALQFVNNRLGRLFNKQVSAGLWGPRFEGMTRLLSECPLDEICALQWQRCVERATEALNAMPPEQWFAVAYEDFVRAPEQELTRMLKFLDLQVDSQKQEEAVAGVHAGSIGRGREGLDAESVQRLHTIIGETLKRLEY